MIQINVGDHVSLMPGWRAMPSLNLHMIYWSRWYAHWIAANLPSANLYFSRLPYQKTLTGLLADRATWINYEDNPRRYGATVMVGQAEMAISSTAFRKGRWVVLATLIHELAHVGGAPGFSHAAEQAVLACGLGLPSELLRGRDDRRTPYEPGILGMNVRGGEETSLA